MCAFHIKLLATGQRFDGNFRSWGKGQGLRRGRRQDRGSLDKCTLTVFACARVFFVGIAARVFLCSYPFFFQDGSGGIARVKRGLDVAVPEKSLVVLPLKIKARQATERTRKTTNSGM